MAKKSRVFETTPAALPLDPIVKDFLAGVGKEGVELSLEIDQAPEAVLVNGK